MKLSTEEKQNLRVIKNVDTFFRLKNNAFYDKTIENVYNRQDVEIVIEHDRYNNLVEAITFKHAIPFSERLVAILKARSTAKLNKFN